MGTLCKLLATALAMRVAARTLQAERPYSHQGNPGKSVSLSVDRGTRKQHSHCQPEVWATELHRPRTGCRVLNRPASGAIINHMLWAMATCRMTSNDTALLSGVSVKGEDDPHPAQLQSREDYQPKHRSIGQTRLCGRGPLGWANELTRMCQTREAQDEVNTSNTGFSQITQKGFFGKTINSTC